MLTASVVAAKGYRGQGMGDGDAVGRWVCWGFCCFMLSGSFCLTLPSHNSTEATFPPAFASRPGWRRPSCARNRMNFHEFQCFKLKIALKMVDLSTEIPMDLGVPSCAFLGTDPVGDQVER